MAWLQLLRIANLPSAISNVLMAFLLANGSWTPTLPLFFLLLASVSLYSAGMILNDVFDVEIDRAERPHRPLAAGTIRVSTAKQVGICLLFAGLLFSTAAGLSVSDVPIVGRLRPALIALLLVIAIWLYDGCLKNSFVAPWLMGLCRALNVLLGASSSWSETGPAWACGFSVPVIWVAVSLWILIAGVTWLARREATQNAPYSLTPATAVLSFGILGLALLPKIPGADFPDSVETLYPLLILLVAIPILRKSILAVVTGNSDDIQKAVVSVLRTLIIFDASVCYLAAPSEATYAICVVSLMIPSLLLSRWIRST